MLIGMFITFVLLTPTSYYRFQTVLLRIVYNPVIISQKRGEARIELRERAIYKTLYGNLPDISK